MHDARELRAIQNAPGMQTHQHRGRRLLLLTEKAVLVGQGQVHTSALHRRQGLDGPGELPLQPALEVQALLKLRHPEFVGLHQFETRDGALGQALRGQPQTHIVHALCRNQDGAATLGILVGDVHLGQLGHHGPAILVAQVGKQHPVVGLAPHHDGRNGSSHQQRHARTQPHALCPVEGGQPLQPVGAGRRRERIERDFSNSRHLAFH